MKMKWICIALLSLLAPVTSWSYTGPEAEDAFFWFNWHKVFQEPSPVPPSENSGYGGDFGLFFANTNKWESFWAMGGVGNWVWGADWFTDKQMDPHYKPFSEDHEVSNSARMTLAYINNQTFGLPWNLQLGTYARLANGQYVTGTQVIENPDYAAYQNEPKMQASLGLFFLSSVETKKFVGNLQWVPGIGSLVQPSMGAVDLGLRTYNFLVGPTAVWRTAEKASAFQVGGSVKRSILGGMYAVKVQNSYRQNIKELDYGKWSEALGDSKLWSLMLEGETPKFYKFSGLGEGSGICLNYSFWRSQQDGTGWRLGLSNYFTRELHMDLTMAYNDWTQDPAVGKTGGYKFLLSYYN
jgi:hypothetical protein